MIKHPHTLSPPGPMSDAHLLRYSRHILLDEIDIAGQQRLQQSSVLVVGCGGLGAAALPYLAAAGVGRLIIADDDSVDLSNLQRQITYNETDIGRPKAEAMQQYLQRLNSGIHIDAHPIRLDEAALHTLMTQADVVLDCSDNFATRRAVNLASIATQTPLISGAAVRFSGQLCFYNPQDNNSPCYACVFGDEPFTDGNCALFGVFAPLVGIIGTAQAAAALRFLLGIGDMQTGILQQYQGLSGQWQSFQARRNMQCPACAQRPSKHNNKL